MNESIKFEFKSGKSRRNLRINVHRGGRVVVTKPRSLSESDAMVFVQKKMPWIRKKILFYETAEIYDWKNWQAPDPKIVLDFVKAKIEKFNSYYKFPVGEIKIKKYTSMWGLCSRHKNLSFNVKLINLPSDQSDYIIVHELCHLAEFNHSQKFWRLVSEQIPDYKRIKKELKLYSFD